MLTDLQLRELYNSGNTVAQVAASMGCGSTKAHRALKRTGPLRRRGPRPGSHQPPGHAEHTSLAMIRYWSTVYGVLPQPKSVRDVRRHHYARFRAAVMRRDGAECSRCGGARRLEVHHVIPIIVDPARALDPSNGVVLCFDCHRGERGVHRAD